MSPLLPDTFTLNPNRGHQTPDEQEVTESFLEEVLPRFDSVVLRNFWPRDIHLLLSWLTNVRKLKLWDKIGGITSRLNFEKDFELTARLADLPKLKQVQISSPSSQTVYLPAMDKQPLQPQSQLQKLVIYRLYLDHHNNYWSCLLAFPMLTHLTFSIYFVKPIQSFAPKHEASPRDFLNLTHLSITGPSLKVFLVLPGFKFAPLQTLHLEFRDRLGWSRNPLSSTRRF